MVNSAPTRSLAAFGPLIGLLSVISCSTPAPSAAEGEDARRATAAGRKPDAAASLPTTDLGWRWAKLDDDGQPGIPPRRPGVTKRIRVTINDVVQAYGVVAAKRAVYREDGDGKRVWSHALDDAYSDGVLLLEPHTSPATLYVAVFSSTVAGYYKVFALNAETGSPRWSASPRVVPRTLQTGASDDENAVQLTLLEDTLVVFGRTSGDAYVDVLDRNTGKRTATRPIAGKWTRLPWHGPKRDTAKARVTLESVHLKGTRYAMEARGKQAKVQRKGPSKSDSWTATFKRRIAGCYGVAALETAEMLFVADYCFGATGVTVHALDASTGKERWVHTPYGIGPIGHSRYSNVVSLGQVHGHLVIYGNESSGRFIDAVDMATGRSIANRSFR